jgi:2'-5' RNA ligase
MRGEPPHKKTTRQRNKTANQDSAHLTLLCFPTTSEQQVRNLIEADPDWVNNIWTEYQIKE